MRLSAPLLVVFATYATLSAALPAAQSDSRTLAARHAFNDEPVLTRRDSRVVHGPEGEDDWWYMAFSVLKKRRGGGGSGGRSGGGRSSSSSSSSSSSGSRGASAASNAGGRTSTGSGSPKTFGSGDTHSYAGGAAVPYAAGGFSALGLAPFLLPLGAIAFFPGLWLHSVYGYSWHNPADVHNTTANRNETLPVLCLCQQYSVCGCDENHNGSYIQDLYNNASASTTANGTYVSKVAVVNGTQTLVVNGTLKNGTTADGGTNEGVRGVQMPSGVWVIVAAVVWGMWFA